MRVKLNGVRFRPNSDVPSTVRIPWNSVTLTFRVNSGNLIDIENVATTITSQTGLTPANNFDIRVLKISIWSYLLDNNTNTQPLVLEVYDLDEPAGSLNTVLQDNPGADDLACVGYIWPADQSNNSLRGNVGRPIFGVSTGEGGTEYSTIVHLDVLFRDAYLSLFDAQNKQ